MTRRELLGLALSLFVLSCGGDGTGPGTLEGTFTLVRENDQPLPTNPFDPVGCCVTLSGTLTLTTTTYDLRASYRNKNNGILFDNSEQGTYTRQGSTLTFTPTGGGGEGFPYLLAPGTVSSDGQTITLLYGDEGPGSNQIEGVFRR